MLVVQTMSQNIYSLRKVMFVHNLLLPGSYQCKILLCQENVCLFYFCTYSLKLVTKVKALCCSTVVKWLHIFNLTIIPKASYKVYAISEENIVLMNILYFLFSSSVTVQPERVYEGGNMTLCCTVSSLKTLGEVCWVLLDHNIQQARHRYSGSRYHCDTGPKLCYNVIHVHSEQSRWACAVFYKGTLRALLPASVTASKHTTTHTPVTHTRTRMASSLQTTHKKNTEDDRDTLATEHTEPSPGVWLHFII